MRDPAGRELRDRLVRLFGTRGAALDDARFDALARDIFAYQLEHNRPYAAYCARRGVGAASLAHWTEIPAAPTAAFREVALVAGDPNDCDAVFRTSGTTRGRTRRGTHYVPDLSVYHASLLPNFQAHLLPDGSRMPMLSLVPPSRELRDSSLAHMIDTVMAELGAGEPAWYASVERGVHHAELNAALERYQREGRAVCLLGTSFSFVHWIDALGVERRALRLPDGSRLMDTGGYKGRSRDVPEPELRAAYAERLGLEPGACVNEYGMTELCSQYYDDTLREPGRGPADGRRRKTGPTWLRTRVVDPETLRPVPDGESGLLQHIDLANVGSVVAVQTEDVGRAVEDGIMLAGRAAGASPRGCSIALDELVRAAADARR